MRRSRLFERLILPALLLPALPLPVLMVGFIAVPPRAHAQTPYIALPGDVPPRLKKRKPKQDVVPPTASLTPAVSVPVAPLGFGPPGATYLGRHDSLASLDFLDENRLLFTFRAPGLLERNPGAAPSDRQMRALVLALPDGKIVSQAMWSLSDRNRYLWMLKNGHFLLRDREGLKIGDASLQLKPLAGLSGRFLSLQVSPAQKLAVLRSLAPSAAVDVVTQILQLDGGQVQKTTHSSTDLMLPISSEGFLETVHAKLDHWSLKLDLFGGGNKILGDIESTCTPKSDFVSESEILVTGCNTTHMPKIAGYATAGALLWESEALAEAIPPLLLMAPDGSRLARETFVLWKPVKPGSEVLWVNAVRGQAVHVYDAASGKLVLETPVSPILDGGGNVAFSPSGRRIAVLNDRAIQVFDLPGH